MTNGYKDQIDAAKKILQGTPECMIPGRYGPVAATPHADLIRDVLDARIPKSEREWAAAREIEQLQTEYRKLEKQYQGLQLADSALTDKYRELEEENRSLRILCGHLEAILAKKEEG